MIPVFLKPDAELDVRAIARWYDDEEPGLGDQFTDHLKAVVSRISALPNQFPTVADGVQRALVRRFPFCVYFVVESDRIVVLGVFHQHRDPSVWRERI
jgi:plasmid stabilization system protein ParE